MQWPSKVLFGWQEPAAYHALLIAQQRRSTPRFYGLWVWVLLFGSFMIAGHLAPPKLGEAAHVNPQPDIELIGICALGSAGLAVLFVWGMRGERRSSRCVNAWADGVGMLQFKHMTQCTWKIGDGFAVLLIELKKGGTRRFGVALDATKAKLEALFRLHNIPQLAGGSFSPEYDLPRDDSHWFLFWLLHGCFILLVLGAGYSRTVYEVRKIEKENARIEAKHFESLRADLRKHNLPRGLIQRVAIPQIQVSDRSEGIYKISILYPIVCIFLVWLASNLAFLNWLDARMAKDTLERARKAGAIP